MVFPYNFMNYMENKSYSFLVWGLIILGIAGIVLGMFAVISKNSGSVVPSVVISNSIAFDDWVEGPKNAKVTLIEYSDFECPACKYYSSQVKQLVADFGDKIDFVYRYFPLEQIHKYAFLAAQAAEAAGRQGKFWEMHDILFSNQEAWANSDNAQVIFISYAADLKLNVAKFTTDLNSQDVIDRVKKSEANALSLNLQGTPTFFLNGRQFSNPASYNDFKKLIESELAK